MFIDSDISWDPIDIIKLLLSDKQLVGGIYPLKYYDWKDLIKDKNNPYNSNVIQSWITRKNQSQFKDAISDEALVQHKLLRYNVNYINNHWVRIDSHCCCGTTATIRHDFSMQ